MRAIAARVAALTLLFATAIPLVGVRPAAANSPDDYGYWWKGNNVAQAGADDTPPESVVPTNGLYAGIGPKSSLPDPTVSPTAQTLEQFAVSALRLRNVPDGATVTLSLDVAPNYNAETVSQSPQPLALDACAVDPKSPTWDSIQGGPWSGHPLWDCDTDFIPAVSGNSGKVVTWTFPAGRLLTDGTLDIILVPRGDKPFQIAFLPPDQQSFDIQGGVSSSDATGSPTPPGADGGGATLDPTAGLGGADQAVDTSSLGAVSPSGDAGAGSTSTATEPGSGSTTGTRRSIRAVRAGSSVPHLPLDNRRERIIAVSILLLLALALLWVGSQPSRAPRLLGSMAGNQPLEVRLTSSVGGVGRFARPRFGRPGRL